jgi:glycosyltransferase involved in cell wall biosynthesis
MNNDRPLVSICTITYNHEKYIEQAIKSVLEQQIDFKIEFVIGDDCSKDKTRDIINKYHALHPDVIVPLFPEKNLGAKLNAIQCLQRCQGKYIAFLEGDDAWADPLKLQKQAAFMEANPDYSICFTDVDIVNDTKEEHPDPFTKPTKEDFTIEDVILTERVFIPTATLFFKNQLPNPLPEFFRNASSGDIAIHLVISDKGKIKYLPGKTAIYRHHAGGVTKSHQFGGWAYIELFKLYEGANAYFEYRYDAVIRKRLAEMSRTLLIYFSRDMKGWSKLKYVVGQSSRYFKYAGVNVKEIAYYSALLFFPSLLKSKKNI